MKKLIRKGRYDQAIGLDLGLNTQKFQKYTYKKKKHHLFKTATRSSLCEVSATRGLTCQTSIEPIQVKLTCINICDYSNKMLQPTLHVMTNNNIIK